MSRSLNSKDWLRRHLTDSYVKRAKNDGYRSRAAYKLIELDDEAKLLKPAMTVVDLGSTPGGWSQVAAKKVGPKGLVVAIDLLDMPPVPGVVFLKSDFSLPEGLNSLVEALEGRQVDLVLSDLAPNLSGIALTDQMRMFGLAEQVLEFSREYLKPSGDMLIKVFQGSGYTEFVKAMREMFIKATVKKPHASRAESSELYLLGKIKRH